MLANGKALGALTATASSIPGTVTVATITTPASGIAGFLGLTTTTAVALPIAGGLFRIDGDKLY
jgi:NAD/NADP transhydrogenase alpha subunit